MDITIAGSATSFTPNNDQLGGINIELQAFDGGVGYGQFPVDDPTGAISANTGRAFRVDEIGTRLIDGFIIDRDRTRGLTPAGSAVVQSFSVADPNALLDGFRISNRVRGSETDYARVIAFAAADVSCFATPWVLDASTVPWPATTCARSRAGGRPCSRSRRRAYGAR